MGRDLRSDLEKNSLFLEIFSLIISHKIFELCKQLQWECGGRNGLSTAAQVKKKKRYGASGKADHV